MARLLASVLAVAFLIPSSLSAESLRAAADRLAIRAAQQPRSASTAVNPYKVPALSLMAGGAALLVIGLAQDRGAEVSASGSAVSVTEKGGSKTALTVLGASAAGAGAFLWFWGEQKRKAGPRLQLGPHGVAIAVRF